MIWLDADLVLLGVSLVWGFQPQSPWTACDRQIVISGWEFYSGFEYNEYLLRW